MPTDDRGLTGLLPGGDLGSFNAWLPRERRTLAQLLAQAHPAVLCHDAGTHAFRRSELGRLAGLLGEAERERLMLPIMLEVRAGTVAVGEQVELVSGLLTHLLGMTCHVRGGRIVIARAQLGVLRRLLPTTTQYVFIP